MMKVYARTREREKAWKFGAYCLGSAVVLGPVLTAIVKRKGTTFPEILRNVSLVLESVCVLPQLLLLRQTTVPTVIDSGYILTLGSYRAFYILNWIVQLVHNRQYFEWTAVPFGVIQTAFYIDFAWVYWTRQRVKLRNGGVVDSDDLSRGFLVSRILGKVPGAEDTEANDGANDDGARSGTKSGTSGRWGPRGISVSADDDTLRSERGVGTGNGGQADRRDAQGREELTGILKDPDDYEDGLSGLDNENNNHETRF